MMRILLAPWILLPLAAASAPPPSAGAAPAAPHKAASSAPNAIVAADGSGRYKTVQEAINAAPQTPTSDKPWTILVKAGTYKELVYIQREKRFVRLVGENPHTTTITYNLAASNLGADGLPIGTFRTPTLTVDADDFTLESLTVENSFGRGSQALALRADGDRFVARNCRFLGFQDTILVNRGRDYFVDCYIAGATDFIFGAATAYFENCVIHCVANGYITAASTPEPQPYGLVFQQCRITAAPGALTYLGRPWRAYGSTIFLHTTIEGGVRPEGWDNWRDPSREATSRYSEYGSTGPGADTTKRVAWAKPITAETAASLTPQKVLAGADNWNPQPRLATPVTAPSALTAPPPATATATPAP